MEDKRPAYVEQITLVYWEKTLFQRPKTDIPFTVRRRKELVESGKASPAHIYPDSGWISYYIDGVKDVSLLLELLRMNYDRLTKRRLEVISEEIEA